MRRMHDSAAIPATAELLLAKTVVVVSQFGTIDVLIKVYRVQVDKMRSNIIVSF